MYFSLPSIIEINSFLFNHQERYDCWTEAEAPTEVKNSRKRGYTLAPVRAYSTIKMTIETIHALACKKN